MGVVMVAVAVAVVAVAALLQRCEGGWGGDGVMKAKVNVTAACSFPAMFNFGDSNSDTGTNAACFYRSVSPNGITYFNKPSGRACDGLLLVDFYAMELSLPFLHPYLDSIGPNFRGGANFASGGSTIRPQNKSFTQGGASPFSLDFQSYQFMELKQRSNDSINEGMLPRMDDFTNALYTIDIGQNDLAAAFSSMTNDQVRDTIPDILAGLSLVVENLYWQGARSFWIHNTGPIGCLPYSVIFKPAEDGEIDEVGCIQSHNEVAQEFNHKLKQLVSKLRKELPLAALTYVDIYSAKYALISQATNLGFVDPFKICCGHATMDYIVGCGNEKMVNGTKIQGTSCSDPLTYISWDGVHYTHRANEMIARQVIDGSLSDPQIPLSAACNRVG
ncbi:GDSL esterase/lipase At5g14450-like isoform X2 [Nymphaea colorata]|uniref:GDSL esterase/lipase At5g14450-like isoform X2 n=1 Tax=Nymphaea colorata TaxID=210225 RepID=UPI00129D5AF7|nr:GDSL esterase/lipase At5g14450-like isoform X2 [Nymphaea colorata]